MIRIYLKMLELWYRVTDASGRQSRYVVIVLALLVCAMMLAFEINRLIN